MRALTTTLSVEENRTAARTYFYAVKLPGRSVIHMVGLREFYKQKTPGIKSANKVGLKL